MSDRKQFLKEQGWNEPLDESPFDLPEGWEGGSVQNTGGSIYCRIWRNEEARVEVIYGLDHKEVAAYHLQDDPDNGLHNNGDDIRHKTASEATDKAKAEKAKELVEYFK